MKVTETEVVLAVVALLVIGVGVSLVAKVARAETGVRQLGAPPGTPSCVGGAARVVRAVVADLNTALETSRAMYGHVPPHTSAILVWGAQAAHREASRTTNACGVTIGGSSRSSTTDPSGNDCTSSGGASITNYGALTYATSAINWTSDCEGLYGLVLTSECSTNAGCGTGEGPTWDGVTATYVGTNACADTCDPQDSYTYLRYGVDVSDYVAEPTS